MYPERTHARLKLVRERLCAHTMHNVRLSVGVRGALFCRLLTTANFFTPVYLYRKGLWYSV